MFDIALFEPQIAPNTGNIIRLVANNGCRLHLIEPFGFKLDNKSVRRAGLDYHDLANVTTYKDYRTFKEAMADRRILACTTKGTRSYSSVHFADTDVLLFGAETHGLHPDVMASIEPDNRIKIPMRESNRSLNLSNAVAIISYEAWRQLDYCGAGNL
jgi:tRNA (cytidine/uridine-2'-O-)-methyltransferase